MLLYRTDLGSDRRSQEKADAGSSSRDQHATSSLHPSAPKVNISTSSHPNTQQQQQSQNKVIMSTLTPSEAGRSPALHINAQNEQEQTHRRAALIPQSALDEEERARLEATLSHARSLLDSQGFNNVYINIPLSIQSELQMKTTHDGKMVASSLWLTCITVALTLSRPFWCAASYI